MADTSPRSVLPQRGSPLLDWLLDSDPCLRWQVMQDLAGASKAEVASERTRVATSGLGARLLSMQAPDGTWAEVAWNPGVDSTMHALVLLREFGLPPESPEARRALELVRANVTWRGSGPDEVADNRFFEGEVEPCINGQVAMAGAYFAADIEALVRRLVGEQLEDGGWNCEAEFGSKRSSFNTTICVLEALLEYEEHFGRNAEVTAARQRGEEYLLARRLMRRLSTGEVISHDRKQPAPPAGSPPVWTQLSFPCWWHYDILRALDYLRRARATADARVGEAVELLLARRGPDGRWPLDLMHRGRMPLDLGETPGGPSRWNTLRALRVMAWAEGG